MINPFLNIFRKKKPINKTENNKQKKLKIKDKNKAKNKTKKKIPKTVTFGISVQQIGNFTNEQDCLQELKNPENKGGKCKLIGVGSYTIEKETRVKR
uniref:Uncharacterized protein n=1 Tax=viral metagenome TaxID=1070528 RepID=A0A6C0HUL2_9ZZZZ